MSKAIAYIALGLVMAILVLVAAGLALVVADTAIELMQKWSVNA